MSEVDGVGLAGVLAFEVDGVAPEVDGVALGVEDAAFDGIGLGFTNGGGGFLVSCFLTIERSLFGEISAVRLAILALRCFRSK